MAVSVGTRLKSWNTKPISRARMRVRSPSPRLDHVAAAERELRSRTVVRIGGVEQPEDVHERALARAGRAHDRDHLAGLDADVDAAQRVDAVAAAEAVGLAQVAAFEEWHRRFSCVGGRRHS